MKQIAFLLFILTCFTSFAQVSKTEKSVSEKLPPFRREYDDGSFVYAISILDPYQTYESRERFRKQSKLFQEVPKLLNEFKNTGVEDITLLTQAGEMLYASGMYSSAENVFKTILEDDKKKNQIKTPQHAETLTNIALLYQAMGRYTLSQIYCDSAYNLRQELFPAESSQYGISINNLAVLKRDLGQYQEAEELISEAIRINEKALTRKSLPYAISLNNQAMIYQSMGNFKEAETVLLESIKTLGETLKEKSINYSAIMTNLALLYQQMERYTDAEIIFLKIIKIKENTVGASHPDYAHMLQLLSALYLHMSEEKNAQVEDMLKKSAVIYKKALGEKDPEYAAIINDLGNYYRVKGNSKPALALLQEALMIQKDALHPKNKNLLKTTEYLGLVYWQMNRMPEAAKSLKEAADKTVEDIAVSVPCMSEADIPQYWDVVDARLQRFYAFALTQAKSNQALSDDVYEYRINTKGFILNDYLKVKNSLFNSEDTSFNKIYRIWLDEKERLSRFYSFPKTRLTEENIDLDTLEKNAQDHLKWLSSKSSIFAKIFNPKKTTFKQIKDKVDQDEAVVEILHFKNVGVGSLDSLSYAALIITKERLTGPEVVLFANGNDLEKKLFNNYKSNLKQKINDENSYKYFWEKIAISVQAKQKIYYSASGVFNEINIGTLLLPTGQYLLDEKNIVVLSNTKDLPHFKNKNELAKQGNSAELFGYPDFGPKGIVPRLPGTKMEVEGLNELLTSSGYKVHLHIQAAATEQKLKTLKDPAILHVATHGYFLEQPVSTKEYVFGYAPADPLHNPYFMSGLLMAGAEKNISGDAENGILRAPEIARLSLDQTNIVFLSATETLYGNYEAGDGMHALQLAFRIAGAEAIIISLWKVSDIIAQEFINAFYTEYLKTKDITGAFLVTRKLIKQKYPEPYFWGAFQIIE